MSVGRRGRGIKGRPLKLSPKVEKDRLAENKRLRAENDYLKNLHALVSERVQEGERTQVVSALRHKHQLSILLEIAKILRATYYYHSKRQASPGKYVSANDGTITNIAKEILKTTV